MTSIRLRIVISKRDYRVDWRFISLRMLNAHVDYDTPFPAWYESRHNGGPAPATRRRSILGRLRS